MAVFLDKELGLSLLYPLFSGNMQDMSILMKSLIRKSIINVSHVFCSDDFQIRRSLSSIQIVVHCLSVLGVFQLLKEKSYPKEQIQPYFDSFSRFTEQNKQTTFRVWQNSQKVHVSMAQVFDDIYKDKIQLYKKGDLAYK